MKLFDKKSKYAWLVMAVTASLLGSGYAVQAASTEHDKGIVEGYYGDSYRSYWKAQGISDGKGTYTYQEDTTLKPKASEGTYNTDGSQTYYFSGIFQSDEDSATTVNMNGHKLDVAMNYDNPGGNRPADLRLRGIYVTDGNLTIKNVNGMNLSANGSYMTNSSTLRGIDVSGSRGYGSGKASLTIENGKGWDNAIRFHKDESGTTQLQYGINVEKNTGTAELTVAGLVDIDAGDVYALNVKGGYSGYQGNAETTATIGGGRFKSTGTAIYINGGYGYINSKYANDSIVDNETMQDVQIDGDVEVKSSVSNYNPTDAGRLTLALNTKDSYLNGTIYVNQDKSTWGKSEKGNVYLAIKNGATWTNKAKGNSHGSDLTQFIGGDSADQTGYIFQQDSGKLNLGTYSGFATIFYDHDNDGTKTSDYTAGDVTINTAKGGSNITLVTNNVDTNNDATVKAVLNALAGKLYYNGAKTGENALDGTVAIAGGLTASSKFMKTSQLYFNETTGQGTTTSRGGQTVTDFTDTLTGNTDTDTAYANAGVIGEDGSYTFDKASTITSTSNAIDLKKDATITADKTLTLHVKDVSNGSGHGINISGANALAIKAGQLNMNLSGTGINSEGLQGIRTTNRDAKLTIDGNVNITANGDNNTIGIYNRGDITINGDVKLDIEGNNGGYQYYGSTGIYATSSMGSTQGGTVTVNGNIDFNGNANGIWSNAGGSVVNVKGGKIIVKEGQTKGYAAIKAENGTVNMNVLRDEKGNIIGADTNDVVIKGNLSLDTGAVDSADSHGTKSEINLGLSTAKSSLTGVIQNAYGTGKAKGNVTFTGAANLWLQNGATWNNEIVDTIIKAPWGGDTWSGSRVANFVGGTSKATAGNIFQKDTDTFTIDNYSGYTNIYYAHTGNGESAADYAAGDTIIKKAAEGSEVSLITDNTDIDTSSLYSVSAVLNALAGKLTYSAFTNGENNLKGLVKIADGLTSSSQSIKVGNITFDSTGKGTYKKPDISEKSSFTTTLTGDKEEDVEYLGNIDDKGTYFFHNDSTITVNADKATAIHISDKDVNIQADKDITLKTTSQSKMDMSNTGGILQETGRNSVITAKNIHIVSTNEGSTGAITVMGDTKSERGSLTLNGNVDMNVSLAQADGGYHILGTYVKQADLTINGNVTSSIDAGAGTNVYYGASHLYATSEQGDQGKDYLGGRITVNGNVDLNGTGQGLFANIGGAIVTVNGGGKIEVPKRSNNGYAAIRAEDGTANMNVKLDENGNAVAGLGNDVNIKGNIAATVGAVNDVDTHGQMTTINLALDTSKSTLQGVLMNGFDRKDGKTTGVTTSAGNTFNGAINLWLQNGAEWNNTLYGRIKFYSDDKYAQAFQGSHAAQLVGGANEASQGYIIQNNDLKLAVDNYSGYATVFYSHTKDDEEADGTKAEHYSSLGDVIIKKAAADSQISLVTDNANIDTNNSETVNKVLNALAGKLFYSDAVNGKTDLNGYVKIADGLTASSFTQTFKTGKIAFDDKTGQGSYEEKEPEKPVQTEFTTAITADGKKDEYDTAGIRASEGNYKFTKDSTVTVKGTNAINADGFEWDEANITVDAAGTDLGLATDQRGVYAKFGDVTVTADNLNVSAEGGNYRDAALVYNDRSKVTINGNVNGTVNGNNIGSRNVATGLYATGSSATTTINGNFTATKEDGYGITGSKNVTGINAISGATITVNGDVDMTVNGTGIYTESNGTVNVNGLKLSVSGNNAALNGNGGAINVNMNADKTAAADRDVIITGNVNGNVNLGMNTSTSKLTGKITGANLWLANGASWNNTGDSTVSKLVGGTEGKEGNIFATAGNITIDNYSGYTNIYYAHEENGEAAENYKAGNTTIKSAAEGSFVSLITDNTGIHMDNEDSVANVLNALAGKLFYSDAVNDKKNLTGYVKIAEGLTASSKTMKTGDITFNKENGQGSYQKPGPTIPDHQVTTSFKTTLTGDKDKDNEYLMGGVIAENGTYKLTKDSDITAVPGIDVAKDLTIDATGKTLNVSTTGNNGTINVTNNGASRVDITAGKLVINSHASTAGNSAGINAGQSNLTRKTVNVNGDVDITATNTEGNNNYVYGILANNADVTVKGKVTAKVDGGKVGGYNYGSVAGISATGGLNRGTAVAGNVTVNGDVDISGNGTGIYANGYGSVVTVNGGGKITIDDQTTDKRGYSAIRAEGGTVNMNVALKDGKATGGLGKDVVLKGNVAATGGNNAQGVVTTINLALDTKDSSVDGVIYNQFGLDGKSFWGSTYQGEINLWLQNGATWTNEVHGYTAPKGQWDKEAEFNGSLVNNFTGGTSQANAGHIFQKDSNTLTIGNYSGYTNIYYAHTGNGEAAENYTAGDTIIKRAATGSVISLITDNTGIHMDSEDSVNAVLNALAGKLIYSDAVNNKIDLQGYVKIADGLTASSKAMLTGHISFDKDTGKGGLKDGSIEYPDDQQKDSYTQGITGDEETDYIYKRNGVLKNDGSYTFTKNPTTITVTDGDAINAKNNITINNNQAKLTLTGDAAGIRADGHDVTVSGSVEIKGKNGVYVNNGGKVSLNGITKITSSDLDKGTAVSVVGENSGKKSQVDILGNSAIDIDGTLDVDGGILNIDTTATNTINGDVIVNNGGNATIKLRDSNSYLTGNLSVDNNGKLTMYVLNGAKVTGDYSTANGGDLTMYVRDGGYWIMKDSEEPKVATMSLDGAVQQDAQNTQTTGTKTLIGGDTESTGGYIDMTDRTQDVTINHYKGYETFIMAHTDDGTFTNGNVTIDKADAKSGVTLFTENNGINMRDKNAVTKVLKEMAQKTTYTDGSDKTTGKNLTGTAKIAPGLTASGVSAPVDYTKMQSGQGTIGAIQWEPTIEADDYVTYVMKGARSAVTTSFHSWRDNMQDTYTGADVADEDGIFAKAYGGKTSSDVAGIKDSNTYWGAQVGYDKALKNGWHTGVAFDYRDGGSKYLLGGEGDNKLYSFGIYGVKKMDDGSYFRVAAKAGRVENEYDIYTEYKLNQLHADYKASAYGLTAEYGKTFGSDESYITPKAQMTWSRVGSKDYTGVAAKNGATMDVYQDSYDSLVGRLGFEAGMKKAKGSYHAGFYVAHEFNGDINTHYFAKDGGPKDTSYDGEDTWAEIVLGGDYQLSKDVQLYGDFTRDLGGDFQKKWKLNAGVRIRF